MVIDNKIFIVIDHNFLYLFVKNNEYMQSITNNNNYFYYPKKYNVSIYKYLI